MPTLYTSCPWSRSRSKTDWLRNTARRELYSCVASSNDFSPTRWDFYTGHLLVHWIVFPNCFFLVNFKKNSSFEFCRGQSVILTGKGKNNEVILIVPDFIISMYSGSCKFLSFLSRSLFFSYLQYISKVESHSVFSIIINRKRLQRSEKSLNRR